MVICVCCMCMCVQCRVGLNTVSDFADLNCESLTDPPNGSVTNNTEFNSQANYTCNPGFVLVGNSSRICQEDAFWTGDEPLCEFDLYTCIDKCPAVLTHCYC